MPSESAENALVARLFEANRRANRDTLAALDTRLPAAGRALGRCLHDGHKILSCGNGGSAADAQHFCSELINRFERPRRALPAIALTTDSAALTAIANDSDYAQVFTRQIEALGRPGDMLVAMSTSGNSANVVAAIGAARRANMTAIALTGRDGGALARCLAPCDIELRALADSTARVQEVHLLIIHSLCRLIEDQLAD